VSSAAASSVAVSAVSVVESAAVSDEVSVDPPHPTKETAITATNVAANNFLFIIFCPPYNLSLKIINSDSVQSIVTQYICLQTSYNYNKVLDRACQQFEYFLYDLLIFCL
jgi:hypothetical protein